MHQDLVVAVRQSRVAEQLRVDAGEQRLTCGQEHTPGALFLGRQPTCRVHMTRLPDLVEYLTSPGTAARSCVFNKTEDAAERMRTDGAKRDRTEQQTAAHGTADLATFGDRYDTGADDRRDS